MSFCIRIDSVKKLSFLTALLMQPMLLMADVTDISAVNSDDSSDASNKGLQGKYAYPRWPASQQASKQTGRVIIPPPPPGPYMSLALNDFPANESSFDHDAMESVSKLDSSNVPMEAFSPDVPWPENTRPARRWVPENGYRYVQPKITARSYQLTQNNLPLNYKQRYRRNSTMNWPAPGSAPSMDVDSAGLYE